MCLTTFNFLDCANLELNSLCIAFFSGKNYVSEQQNNLSLGKTQKMKCDENDYLVSVLLTERHY